MLSEEEIRQLLTPARSAVYVGGECGVHDLDADINTYLSDSAVTVPDIGRGYTVTNDIDALDQQGRTARKAFNTSAP